MGNVSISGGADYSFCKDGRSTGLTFRDDPPDDITLHYSLHRHTVKDRLNVRFLDECVGHDLE